jgi:hypothetical protein
LVANLRKADIWGEAKRDFGLRIFDQYGTLAYATMLPKSGPRAGDRFPEMRLAAIG